MNHDVGEGITCSVFNILHINNYKTFKENIEASTIYIKENMFLNTFMSTPISKRRRTGGGNERAYISAILKNRARNNLSRAFMRGFVPSNGILVLLQLQKVLQFLMIEDNELFRKSTLPQVCFIYVNVHLSMRILFAIEVRVLMTY